MRWGKEGEPNLPLFCPPPLPLPGYFLESCISVATLGADTSGGLSADAGRGSGFFLRGRWPRRNRWWPCPRPAAARGASSRLLMAPAAPPRTGCFLLRGHILSRRRGTRLLQTRTPPSSPSPHTSAGRGLLGGASSGPFIRALETASDDQGHTFQRYNLYL